MLMEDLMEIALSSWNTAGLTVRRCGFHKQDYYYYYFSLFNTLIPHDRANGMIWPVFS